MADIRGIWCGLQWAGVYRWLELKRHNGIGKGIKMVVHEKT
jgi:hypothetical protein